MQRTLAAALVGAAAAGAGAQTSIDPVNRFSWQENTGWMNWRDANGGMQGVRDHMTYLSGFIWCENVGWISLGDGTPASGIRYSNQDGSDYGVNVSSTGLLSGFGWGENIGWVNFESGALASPNRPARIDGGALRLRGAAWCENVGWINLDVAVAGQFVGTVCYANCDGSTAQPVLNVNDFICFQALFAAGDPGANCDRGTVSPILNVNDFVCFQQRFVMGCP